MILRGLRDDFSWTNPEVNLRFAGWSPARVAELADAVDSKSTDESLVGSTPTPGTISARCFAGLRHQRSCLGRADTDERQSARFIWRYSIRRVADSPVRAGNCFPFRAASFRFWWGGLSAASAAGAVHNLRTRALHGAESFR